MINHSKHSSSMIEAHFLLMLQLEDCYIYQKSLQFQKEKQ